MAWLAHDDGIHSGMSLFQDESGRVQDWFSFLLEDVLALRKNKPFVKAELLFFSCTSIDPRLVIREAQLLAGEVSSSNCALWSSALQLINVSHLALFRAPFRYQLGAIAFQTLNVAGFDEALARRTGFVRNVSSVYYFLYNYRTAPTASHLCGASTF